MTRKDRIATQLDHLQERGAITDWYSYAPGDSKGQRWIVAPRGLSQRTLTTREAEAFILGASAVLTDWRTLTERPWSEDPRSAAQLVKQRES